MGRERKKTFPKFGNGKGMKKILSHISGTGIRGYQSQEYPGTGTGMEKKQQNNEKEFRPTHSQPIPPPFLITPPLLVIVTATINKQKKMILFTITNTFAASLFATELSKIPCLFSHLLINSFYLLNINSCKKCRGS